MFGLFGLFSPDRNIYLGTGSDLVHSVPNGPNFHKIGSNRTKFTRFGFSVPVRFYSPLDVMILDKAQDPVNFDVALGIADQMGWLWAKKQLKMGCRMRKS